jgi:hypothetical protein
MQAEAGMQSVVIVDLKSVPSWHDDLAQAFIELGKRAATFVSAPHSLRERFDKSARGSKWFESSAAIERLLETCRRARPDLVIFLGMFVLPARVVEALQRGLGYTPRLAGWVCDCFRAPQFEPWIAGDCVFYFDSFLADMLPAYYPRAEQRVFLPLAANPRRYFPVAVPARDERLLFAGNVSANRRALLDRLSSRVPLAITGPNARGRRFNRRRKLSATELNQLYNTHQVVLNINQKPNTEHGANLRVFEVGAAGGLLLTEACRDLPALYEPEHEVLIYSTLDELIELYDRARADDIRTRRIATAARNRTLAEHTFVARARRMLEAFA